MLLIRQRFPCRTIRQKKKRVGKTYFSCKVTSEKSKMSSELQELADKQKKKKKKKKVLCDCIEAASHWATSQYGEKEAPSLYINFFLLLLLPLQTSSELYAPHRSVQYHSRYRRTARERERESPMYTRNPTPPDPTGGLLVSNIYCNDLYMLCRVVPTTYSFFFILIKGKKKFRSSLYTVERVKKENKCYF